MESLRELPGNRPPLASIPRPTTRPERLWPALRVANCRARPALRTLKPSARVAFSALLAVSWNILCPWDSFLVFPSCGSCGTLPLRSLSECQASPSSSLLDVSVWMTQQIFPNRPGRPQNRNPALTQNSPSNSTALPTPGHSEPGAVLHHSLVSSKMMLNPATSFDRHCHSSIRSVPPVHLSRQRPPCLPISILIPFQPVLHTVTNGPLTALPRA